MTARFFNKDKGRTGHFEIKLDELPRVQEATSLADIKEAVDRFGGFEYVESIKRISADDLPPVDYGYYAVYEIKKHEYYADCCEEITYEYIAVFEPNSGEDE